MSVRDNDPEELRSVTLYRADGTEIISEVKEHDEWMEGFKGSDMDTIEVFPPTIATGESYNDSTQKET